MLILQNVLQSNLIVLNIGHQFHYFVQDGLLLVALDTHPLALDGTARIKDQQV